MRYTNPCTHYHHLDHDHHESHLRYGLWMIINRVGEFSIIIQHEPPPLPSLGSVDGVGEVPVWSHEQVATFRNLPARLVQLNSRGRVILFQSETVWTFALVEYVWSKFSALNIGHGVCGAVVTTVQWWSDLRPGNPGARHQHLQYPGHHSLQVLTSHSVVMIQLWSWVLSLLEEFVTDENSLTGPGSWSVSQWLSQANNWDLSRGLWPPHCCAPCSTVHHLTSIINTGWVSVQGRVCTQVDPPLLSSALLEEMNCQWEGGPHCCALYLSVEYWHLHTTVQSAPAWSWYTCAGHQPLTGLRP